MKFFKIASTLACALVITVISIAADYNNNNNTSSMMNDAYETNTWNKATYKPYGTMSKPSGHMNDNDKNIGNSMLANADYDTDYDTTESNENLLD